MGKKNVAYLQLHIAVLLYGLTAILGDLISLSAVALVWWRVLIASFSLLFFIKFGKTLLNLDKKLILKYVGIGFLIGFHWIAFFGAIKYSNASVTLVAMATTSLFTSLLEPVITKKPFIKFEILLGCLIIPPMIMIATNLDFSMLKGFGMGILSAFLASLFSSYNKLLVDKADPYQISFLEMFSAFLFVSMIIPFLISNNYSFMPQSTDWIYLLLLSLGCTTFAYVISMMALKHVSAFDATLVINLEPVYGILLAIFILKEHKELSPSFYFGVVIILLIVFSHPFLKKRFNVSS